jgi:Zn-dependent protease
VASAKSGSRYRIGQVFGISVYLHSSWFIIFALISYSLATQFTAQHPAWRPAQHWTLGILASLLFFVSVLVHELGHSIVALRCRLPVNSITLFVFGGLSEIGREPANAKQEFTIAAAGPLTSFLLAGLFFAASRLTATSEMGSALFGWLAEMNFILAVFNLAPGFPLDGGRIFRAIAWGITGNFNRATKLAAHAGQWVAYAMIAWGIFLAVRGDMVGGIWLAFIGWFLLSAARESLMQINIRGSLDGLHASDVMITDAPVVSGSMTLEEYAQEVMRRGQRLHIVSVSGQMAGVIALNIVQKIPRSEWPVTSVQAVMQSWVRIHSASPSDPVLSVLKRMQKEGIGLMPVMDGSQWVGMISRDSILAGVRTNPHVSNAGNDQQG